MAIAKLRTLATSICWLFVVFLAINGTAELAVAAGFGDDDSSSSSRRSSRSSSSDDDDEGFDDDDDDSDSDRRASRSRSSRAAGARSETRDSSRSSRGSRRSSGGSRGRSSNYAPPAVVFGQNYERAGVRPRGTLLSVEAFEALPCKPETSIVGATTYYRCDGVWYNQVNHEGWVCYSEIHPPAGVSVSSLPRGHETINAGSRTLYATDEAFYEVAKHDGRTRYVVVEPSVGLTLDHLPANAKAGIPVKSGRNTYYRYLGVFYREEKLAGNTHYVAAPNPFMPTPAPTSATAGTAATAPSVQASVPPPATATVTYR